MKNLLIALLLSIAFISCTKEDVVEENNTFTTIYGSGSNGYCGYIIELGEPTESCPYGYFVVNFFDSIDTMCLRIYEETEDYYIGELYCI